MFSGEYNNKSNNKGVSYMTIGGIVLIEFLLSATWLPYGIFYTELVKLGAATVTEGLWVPIIVRSVRILCNPLTRKISEHFSDNECDNYRQIIAISSLTAALAIILGACSRLILIEALTYGIFCGICSSLISNQLKEATYEDFQSQPLLFEGLQQVANALSLFFMPHVFYYLVSHYSTYEAEFLFAALLLNVIPMFMITKTKQRDAELNLSRYKTFSTLYNQKTTALPTLSITIPHERKDSCSSESSSDDSDEIDVKVLEAATNTVTAVQTVVPVYHKNFMGVDILPEIPEEDEIADENVEKLENIQKKEAMEDSLRQYGRLSAKFEDFISNEDDDCNKMIKNFERDFGTGKKQTRFKRFNIKCGCSPYRKYLYRRRLNRIINCFCGIFIKPLWKALRVIIFYPCLITKVLATITPAIYVVFLPYATVVNKEEYSSQTDLADCTMLLSLIAFPWLCLLVFLPWLINSSKSILKIIFCLGLVTLGISTFLINIRVNYDVVAIASLLFGISYGGIELSQNIVFKDAAGLQQWRVLKDPLEVVSGLLTIGLYSVITSFGVNIMKFLGGSTVVAVLLASAWIFIFYKDKLRVFML